VEDGKRRRQQDGRKGSYQEYNNGQTDISLYNPVIDGTRAASRSIRTGFGRLQ